MQYKVQPVSVVVPAYNGERTVLRTVGSIISQSYRPLQLIVVDDASSDSTACLVEDFVNKNGFSDRFKLVRHDVNLGLSRSLNDGFREADADFVLILHQDCELIGDDWIKRAVDLFADEKVAIVTGYYGISDEQDENFTKRSFGVLRKQFHSRPEVAQEEVTFSEGKCDLCRKRLLLETGGFPVNYRIAGEDLIISYKLRSLGYKIIKSYELSVVQRFGGTAQTFSGNLKKEFLFGKVMGGVFSEFKLFLFKSVRNSKYNESRSMHRASQPAFVLAFFIVAASAFFVWWLVFFLLGLMLVRWAYHLSRVLDELKSYENPISHPFLESSVTSAIGVLTDFAYSLGFSYGLVLHSLRMKL